MTIKKVLLLGSKGSMGRRYSAIFNYLDVEFIPCDMDDDPDIHDDYSGILIATPTEGHYDQLMKYCAYGVPILCEKPVTKDLTDLLAVVNACGSRLRMVNQYEYLVDEDSYGATIYDYYNTGKDGLHWDCMNIIGLAKTEPIIQNISPSWKCTINGTRLHLTQMDGAYIKMIHTWLKNPCPNTDYIMRSHRKAIDYAACSNRDSGKIHIDAPSQQMPGTH